MADALRLVLFGLPNAGKSSLLGALSQAAYTQEALLDGTVADTSRGLAGLCHRLYDGEAQSTAAEIVPYTIEYQPHDRPAVPAVLLDCDGRVACKLLAEQRPPGEQAPPSTLAQELCRADTLVLVVDAAAPAARLESDFAEFARFLLLVQQGRGQRLEVSGLPVFLVLTKCDLLAQPGDSTVDWMERIERHKTEVDERFRQVLSAAAAPVFGQLELHLWATAVKRPALQGTPARPREPFQVAELFRQGLLEADAHRRRVAAAGRRLFWTAAGSATVIAGLLAALVGLFAAGSAEPPSLLQLQVEGLMAADRPSPAERLNGGAGELREQLDRLRTLHDDPGFDALPGRERDFVAERTSELVEYLAYAEKLSKEPLPADTLRVSELDRIKGSLVGDLALPHPDWAPTLAGRARQQRLDECDALLEAVRKVRDWYLDGAEQARQQFAFTGYRGALDAPGIDWRLWIDDVEKTLNRDRTAPFTPKEPLPGASSLTYDAALHLDQATDARGEWESARQVLGRIRDLCAAVGLATGIPGKPAVLLIPRSGFTLQDADKRLHKLEADYPKFRTDFMRAGLPDALLPELARAVQSSYEYVLEPARAAVLARLKKAGAGPRESVERWTAVRNWLADPKELAAWRVLAVTLARLHDPQAPDPVVALADFLKKTGFRIEIKKLVLEVPEALRVKPAFEAALNVFQPRSSADKPALVFKMDGDGQHVAPERLWRYPFGSDQGGVLDYQPGDELWATLPLRDDLVFTWSRCRSALYQFERLHRPPRLHKPNEAGSAGTLADKVRLILIPADGVPEVPDLMPAVELAENDVPERQP